MKGHLELHKLVFCSLEIKNAKGNYPTAKELFYEAKQVNPQITKDGFKSFARLINIFKDIAPVEATKGVPRRYKVIIG